MLVLQGFRPINFYCREPGVCIVFHYEESDELRQDGARATTKPSGEIIGEFTVELKLKIRA